jgi:hypothetical protein
MAFNALYDSVDLLGVIETIPPDPGFFLDRYFRKEHKSTKEYIAFDEISKDLVVMAPYVSPVVEAKPQRGKGATMKQFSPAYVKPKHFVKPGDFTQRQPGESLNGDSGQQSRWDRAVVDLLETQKRQIEARWEHQAALAVINGSYTVDGEDYPGPVNVDFGRSPGNNVTVVGAGLVWSNPAAPAVDQLEDWSVQLLDISGYAGTDIIMSPEAWKKLRANAQMLRDAAFARSPGPTPNLQPRAATREVQAVGSWGNFNFFVCTKRFKEQDGTIVRALQADEMIMTAPPSTVDGSGGVQGVKVFGAIQDFDADLQPFDIFPKMWREKDPSGEALMSQSAPLMVPANANAVLKIKVA